MNNVKTHTDNIEYSTRGTCCKTMHLAIQEGVIQNVEFIGGCPGNLLAIKELLKGMQVEEVIEKFKGITCGDKSTSCADQLAVCLEQYKSKKV